MEFRTTRLTPWVGGIILLFPILLLCVPRGAGIFIGATVLFAVLSGRGLGQAWRTCHAELWPLGAAILAVLVVLLLSRQHFGVPWSEMDNPSRLLLALLVCLVVVYARPSSDWLWRGINIGLASALVVVVFQRFVQGIDRPSAWIQAIAFANMVAALGLVGFVRPGVGSRAHIAAWVSLGLAGVVLVLNGTRGAWLAMSIPAVPLLFVRYPSLRAAKFLAALMAIVALAVTLYAVPGSPVGERIDRVTTEIHQFQNGNENSSVGARLALWEVAIDTFRAHPWLGIGASQFNTAVKASRFCAANGKSEVCVLGHAHNDILEAASTMGLPGLLATLGIVIVPGWLFAQAWRAGRQASNVNGERVAAAGLAVVVASFISGLTQVTMAHQANVVFYAGIIGLLLGLTVVQTRFPLEPK
ncbi:O-antigen ligase family protein [Ralstonia sp. UBA689]|uniref:O-antigen ligase family protein n=1 Tax=Ralstonia sp. UBA689 TaxID=1947373 RepID=UPI0025EA8489|nr:O-antigen ligase family protein [Ralstonia sp. UBA689]